MDSVAGSICAVHAAGQVGVGDATQNAEQLPAAGGGGCVDPTVAGAEGAAQGPAGAAGRGPCGRRARTERRAAARARTKTEIREAAVRAARAQHAGRARAAARLERGEFAPHPGWRNFIPPGWRVLSSQNEALQILTSLIAEQPWRAERITSWTQITCQLIAGMDWATGIIAALTAERLADAGDRSTRTVSRVIAWLQDTGVLFLIEPGATAEFLGGDRNRTPTYVFITNAPLSSPDVEDQDEGPEPGPPDHHHSHGNPQLTTAVDDLGDPPNSPVEITTRTKRLEQPCSSTTSWPGWQVPQTSMERSAAGRCVLDRLGLDHSGVPGRAQMINLPRWWAMLKPWWDAGWSPRGLAWAIEHHPDHPAHHRGDALAGATDPTAVLGSRLAPWRGRARELPTGLVGIRGNHHVAQQTERLAHLAAAARTSGNVRGALHRSEARTAARAFFAASQAASRARRSGS